MRILALDTSSRPGSCACWEDGEASMRSFAASPSTAELLPGEVLALLAELGRTLQDIDVFAVVAGPGSFTGLRVGIACMQGLALTSGKRIVAIPTLEAMLSAAIGTHIPPKVKPLFVVCMDGGRGDVFYAASYERTLSPVEWAVQPAVGEPDELIAAVDAIRHGRTVVAAGDGAVRERAHFESRGYLVAPLPAGLAIDAAYLAAARVSTAVRPHDIAPIYVRRPDVELARERAALRPVQR